MSDESFADFRQRREVHSALERSLVVGGSDGRVSTWYKSDEGYADVGLDLGRNDYEVVCQIGFIGQPVQQARGKTDANAASLPQFQKTLYQAFTCRATDDADVKCKTRNRH